MEEHKDASGLASLCRTAQRSSMVLIVCLLLHTADAFAAGPRRHFDLDAGDATLMLNEFSHQTDLQVLYDFNVLKGMRTRAVKGEYDASDALKMMLRGTNLEFDFVNERTLAVTPVRKKPSLLRRMFARLATRPAGKGDDDGLEQVLISGAAESGTQPLLGAQTITLNRTDIDQSGLATAEDFLHTLPEVFGGGPNEDTVLGREAASNSARGSGVNIRGIDAGSTLVLIDGHRIAPSGTDAAFTDISNIPLTIVDHIDILPDGVSSRYGADAVGGVVNFVTRNGTSGVVTQVREGGVTNGAMGEHQFSQTIGTSSDSDNMLFSFEYYKRDALLAQDRWQETNDLTPYGGSNFDIPFGSAANIVGPSGYFPVPQGSHTSPLTSSSLSPGAPNLYDSLQGTDVTPAQDRWSLFAKGNFRLTDDLALSTEGLFTRRTIEILTSNTLPLPFYLPPSNPFYVNPTGVAGPVQVWEGSSTYFGLPVDDNRIDTGNFSMGLATSDLHGWALSGFAGYSFERQHAVQHGEVNQAALATALADSNPATAFNPFADAADNNPSTLASIGGNATYQALSTLKTFHFEASTPSLSLPGGPTHTTIGAEYRIQDFSSTTIFPGIPDSEVDARRTITAGFAEVRIPLIAERNQLMLVRGLEVSLGIRHETYSDVGSVNVPKAGLVWQPNELTHFRWTWTRSFRPPDPTDLSPKTSNSELVTIPDSASPTGSATVLGLSGSNPNLQPETARTWTLGADFSPRNIPGLSFSLNYFNINYSNRINYVFPLDLDVLTNPQDAWLVQKNFTAAQINAACNETVFLGTPGTCQNTPISAIIDNRLRNIATVQTQGVDLLAHLSLAAPKGRFDFGFNGTYLLQYSQADTPGSPLLNIVSTQNYPINLRFRGSAGWSWRGISLSSFVNFTNRYRDTLDVPNREIGSWTTVDLQLSYEIPGNNDSILGNTRFALSSQNLFNTLPPFFNNPVGVGYDQENASLVGRVVSLDIMKRW